MLKYIQNTINSLKSASTGMKKNADKWANQPLTAAELDEAANNLEKADAEVTTAEELLEQKREAARRLVDSYAPKLKQVASLALGLHVGEEVKLNEYGVTLRKDSTAHSTPAKSIITNIANDTDGIGFVISIAYQPNVDHYEIERGVAANANDLALAPPFPLYKTTKKITVVDDDVKQGIRYFYRVRAISTAGPGEWSEAVNKVQ